MLFFPVFCFGIPDLALGILEMLIGVCFGDVLQPELYQFVPGMIWVSASWLSKYIVFTVNLCSLQVWATYKKILS